MLWEASSFAVVAALSASLCAAIAAGRSSDWNQPGCGHDNLLDP